MKYEIAKCSQCDCGSKRPIVNKRHYFCKQKNYERLHGETEYQSMIKKQKNKVSISLSKSSKKKFKQSTIKKSKKQSEIDNRYLQTIKEIDQEREPVCEGCGRYQGGDVKLSHSHIISRRECHNIGRTDLIYDARNIRLHCMNFGEHEGCHEKWEGIEKHHLLDFDENMKFIRRVSEELYQLKLMKLNNK